MRTLLPLIGLLVLTPSFAADAAGNGGSAHRYVIERTFPAGALDGLDAATKQKVNTNNASVGVNWVRSYANAEKTKTYCVYEGPNEGAIRKAATLNGLPVDRITEVPVQTESGAAMSPVAQTHRYLTQRTVPASAPAVDAKTKSDATNARLGVRWVTTYASADKTKSYSIYEAPNEAAVRNATETAGMPVDAVTEVPVTLLPH